jgi:hypothetical protein
VSELALGRDFSRDVKDYLDKLLKSLEERPDGFIQELDNLKLNLRTKLTTKKEKDKEDKYRLFVILMEKLIDEFFKLTKECACKVVKDKLSEELTKKKLDFADRVEYIGNLICKMDIHDIFVFNSSTGKIDIPLTEIKLKIGKDLDMVISNVDSSNVYNFIYNALTKTREDLFPELVEVLNKIGRALIKTVNGKWDEFHQRLEKFIIKLDKTIEQVKAAKKWEELKNILKSFS